MDSLAASGYPPERGEPMPAPKFKVGDVVAFKPGISRDAPIDVYEVVKVLPGNGERQYRIKSAHEGDQRVAQKSEFTLTCRFFCGC
jgi:hypothetical protein